MLVLPISRSPYWFLKVYLGLMIVSPIINLGLKQLSRHQLRIWIGVFTLFTIYSCYLGANRFNPNGFTFGHAMYMYCLAHWLREERNLEGRISGRGLLGVTLLFMAGTSVLYGLVPQIPIINYNFVGIMAASLALLACFTRIHLKSRIVNGLAQASLGCYLLQEGLMGNRIYLWQHAMAMSEIPLWEKFGWFAVCFVGFWLLSIPVTMLARWVAARVLEWIPERWMLSFKA